MSVGLFIFSYVVGMALGWHSASTVALWASMEVSTMATLPLLSGLSLEESDGAMVYFIFQTLGSMMILSTSVIIVAGVNGFGLYLAPLIMCLGIFMKMGSFPSYYWVSRCYSKLSWSSCFLVSVFQKILPLWLLHNLSVYDVALSMVEVGACLTSMVGVALSPGVNDFRILFGYSSIIQNGFMMILSSCGFDMSVFYLSIYGVVSMGFCFTMWRYGVYFTSCVLKMSKPHKASIALLLSFYAFSLAGFPPYLGFVLKIIFLDVCMVLYPLSCSFLIIISSVSFYFYYQIFTTLGLSECTGRSNLISAISSENYLYVVLIGFMVNFSGLLFFWLVALFY